MNEIENDIPWVPWDERHAPNVKFYEGPIEARDDKGQVHILMPLYSILGAVTDLKDNIMYSLGYAEIDRSQERENYYPALVQYCDGFFIDWRPIDHIPKKKSVYF